MMAAMLKITEPRKALSLFLAATAMFESVALLVVSALLIATQKRGFALMAFASFTLALAALVLRAGRKDAQS